MASLSLALRAYLIVVCALAAALLVKVAEVPALPEVARAFLFGGVAAVVQLRPMRLTAGMKITAEDAATFAAAITLGPFLGALVAGASTLAAVRSSPGESPTVRILNTAVAVLGAGCAGLTFATFASAGLLMESGPALLAAAVTKYIVETAVVDLAVALHLWRNPFASWWRIHRRDLGPHAALYALGILAAVLSANVTSMILFFLLPAAILLFLQARSAHLSSQTEQVVLDLADRVDARDPYTRDHSKRTAQLSEQLARQMGLDNAQIELVRLAARVHDIGNVAIDDDVLLKRGPLTAADEQEMRRHADIGAGLLCQYPGFWEAAPFVLAHHEQPDGTGYPRGLRGSELKIEAAVIAVADAYDAMTNDRPYRRALSWSQVRAEFLRHSGTQWDPRAVTQLVELIDAERGRAVAAQQRRVIVVAR